jgi:polyhydroxyalkanoate synthesis regulator phasin
VEKRTKTKIVAGGIAGFLLAVLLGAVGGYAAAEAFSGDDEPETVAAQADFESDDESRDESESLTEALEFLVDEAVDAGRLTEEEGERLKDRLRSSELPRLFPYLPKRPFVDPGFEFFDRGGFGFFLGDIVDLDAAASYLDLSETALRDELEDGKSLADVARDRNKSVDGLVDALADDAEQRIDEAVEDGRLSEERADRLKEDLEDRLRDRVEDQRRLRGFPFDFDFEFDLDPEPRPGS